MATPRLALRFLDPERHAVPIATALGVAALVVDYLTGPDIQIPVAAAFPVAIAAWYRSWSLGAAFGVGLSALRLGLAWHWEPLLSGTLPDSALNALLRAGLLGALAYFVGRHRMLQQRVRVLSGILPICSFCRKIRNVQGTWESLEGYIRGHSEADFSHSVCPGCAQEHYGEYFPPEGSPPGRR